jgi:hypothetical protein
MPETAEVRFIPHKQVSKALHLRWAWFSLDVHDDQWRTVLVRTTEVGEEQFARRTQLGSVFFYKFTAVDQEGNVYVVTMEKDVVVDFSTRYAREHRRRDSSSHGRSAKPFAQITPKPEPKPRVQKQS